MSVAFDTLKYANQLESVKFSKDQAEKLAILQKEIIDRSQDDLATKKDLLLIKNELEHKIEIIAKELTIKMGAMFIASVGILIAVIKL